jgi:hypothetical protein
LAARISGLAGELFHLIIWLLGGLAVKMVGLLMRVGCWILI